MSFDPDAYLAKKTQVAQTVTTQASAGFNPDAYLEKKVGRQPNQFPVSSLPQDQGVINEGVPVAPEVAPRKYPKFGFNPDSVKNDDAMPGLESIGNAISLGYLPQIQAFVENNLMPNPTAEVDAQLKEQGFQVPEQSYVNLRDENIKRQEIQAQQNPEKVLGGNILGAITTAPIMAGAGQAVGLGQKAGALNRFKDAAIFGAGYGAAVNPGDTEGEVNPIQAGERGINAAKSAAMGLVAQGAGEAVAKGSEAIKKAPGVFDKAGNVTAVKSIGAIGRDMKKLFKNNGASELGDTLIKNNIVSAGDTLEDVAQKALAAKSETGKKIGEIYKRTSEELKNANLAGKNKKLLEITELDGEKLADISMKRIEKSLKNDLARTEVKNKIKDTLDELKGKGNKIDLLDLQEMKTKLDKRINYDKALKDMPEVQQEFKNIRDVLSKAIQNRVRVLGRVSGNKELVNELRDANKLYGQYSKAESIASNRAREIEGQRFLSLTETISGSAGATVGAMTGDSPEERVKNAMIGFVAGATAKKADKFLTPAIARSAKRLGKVLQSPANFAKYGEPLIEAAKKSPQEFQAFIKQLNNDPEFKKILRPGMAK
jgi:hypothetical protein